ncbi:histidine phosphatase family protein [Belliella kenyensis]|uniref:Histidine phosphatase family protein n=1 Tax=Belliella kenyensis TaxID=1472724 RepID=A0ABV8EMC3_9BACT|nr:histidine phosphatase family protein [Belliella kenyensis]MCH7403020.1 histidine phosphatase family protein [Belliella kenyensis]MDN3605056.1 histidine phosphatase family protein [Belliella kenyensis]
MLTKKIYLVRHGQTDYNLKGVVQGSGIDAPLNDHGRLQAAAFFDAYKDVPFEKAFYTGLQRTKQSIQQFLDLGIPSESVPELNEISWGDYEGQPMTPDENAYYQSMLAKWASGDLDFAIKGGESPNQVSKRLRIGLEKILNQDQKVILICMHGRAMRMLLSILMKVDLKYMDQFEHRNLGLYVLEIDGKGNVEIIKNNSGDHLQLKALI